MASKINKFDNESLNKVYSFYSPVYDLIFGKIMQQGRKQSIKLLELEEKHLLLDVGVGTGLNLPFLPRECNIMGIDICSKMLKKASKRAHKCKMKHVELCQMDAMNMNFPENTFDACLMLYTLSVVEDPLQVLKEVKRVCKSNATIIITNHFESDNPLLKKFEGKLSKFNHILGFDTARSVEIIEKANLYIEETRKVNSLWQVIRCVNPPKDDDTLRRDETMVKVS